MLKVSDGVIVDVPIVKLCGQYGRDCIPYAEELYKEHERSGDRNC